MKRKILAIWSILLLIAIPLSVAEASQTSNENDENITVQLGTATSEGIFETETLSLTENELIELESAFSSMVEQLHATENLNGLEGLIDNILGGNNPIKYSISKTLLKFKLSHSRAFIISFGRSYSFNLFKQNDLKIKKPITLWFYTQNNFMKATTLIIRPLALMSSELLRGRQFGMMTGFTGFYINVVRTFPEQSYVFFIGTARHANGFELSISR